VRVEELKGDADDEYMLALILRLRELNVAGFDGQVQFVMPQYREIYRSLESGVPDELQPYMERAQEHMPEVRRLSVGAALNEFAKRQADVHARVAGAERRQLDALLSDGGLTTDEALVLLERNRQEMQAR
jgi:hypothetical protein